MLVGHSFGGTVIARVAEEIPERLRRLVFRNAFVPLPGTRVEDDLSGRLGLRRLVRMPGSHEAIFTRPRLLAEKLVHAGRD